MTEQERKFIEKMIKKMQSTPWGTIVVKMKGGRPVMLSTTEDEKLD